MKALPQDFSPILIGGTIHRIVESQEMRATQRLVNNLAEHDILEHLLEAAKPALPKHTEGYHYLLATPFRYPPLPYGSRFGTRHEPSLFYGAQHEATCIAECAFYRFVFLHSMATPPPQAITTHHTLFSATFRAQHGANLALPTSHGSLNKICHPSDYTFSQTLGHTLRNAGLEGFLYPSARDPKKGTNIALFTAKAFTKKHPTSMQEWSSEIAMDGVCFKNLRQGKTYLFEHSEFTDQHGHFPQPA